MAFGFKNVFNKSQASDDYVELDLNQAKEKKERIKIRPFTLKKYDEAMPLFERTLALNPNVWQAHQNIAVINFERGDIVGAESHIKKAIEINPEISTLHSNLGIVYYRLGKNQEALKEFQLAVELEPKNENAKAWVQKILSEK